MRLLGMVIGVVFVLLLGIFIGIGLDWATWFGGPSQQKLVIKGANGAALTGNAAESYDLEGDGKKANLMVYWGETISLSRKGGAAGGSTFKFGTSSPCTAGTGDGYPTCKIDNVPDKSIYYFTCDATDTYKCKDPGLQVRSTGTTDYELKSISFPSDLKSIADYLDTRIRPTLDINLMPAVQNPGNKP